MVKIGEPSFPSAVLAQEFLSHASPEVVYAWLIANAGDPVEDRYTDCPFSTELLTALLERHDPIINLGLASVVGEPDILRELWSTKNEAVRLAIAGNQHRNNSLLGAADRFGWADNEEISETIEKGSLDFIKSWSLNPRLGFGGLEQVFLKKGIYTNLSEDKWLGVIYWALQNPNLIVSSDEFYEGLDLPAYQAAWSLLLTLPNNRDIAHLLSERYASLNRFLIPLDVAALTETLADLDNDTLTTFEADTEKWLQKNDQRNVDFLNHVFQRWSASASKDEKAFDSDGKENYGFQILRQNIASAAANAGDEVTNFVKNHDDIYVRRGYYRGYRVSSSSDLHTVFEKDGKDFLEAAIYNEHLYAAYPKAVRTTFRQLVEDSPRYEDYPVPSFRSIWDYQANELFKREPSRFPDPNVFEEDTLGQADEAVQSGSGKAGRVARYAARWAWRAATNVFYALVVWYVLSQLRGHPENIIVPALGLIYVALRTGGVSLAQVTLQQTLALDAIYEKLRSMSDTKYTRLRREVEAIEQMKFRLTGDMIIESLGLSAVSLICLWFLFNAL